MHLVSMYQTKFDAKMIKMKSNYTANMIMNIAGRVCQLFHYFASKQGLAINLPWPALKSKQRTYVELSDTISWSVCTQPTFCGVDSHLGQSTQTIKYHIRWVPGREVLNFYTVFEYFYNFTIFFILLMLLGGGGGNYLVLPMLGFPLSKKAMPISVIIPAGYFHSLFLWRHDFFSGVGGAIDVKSLFSILFFLTISCFPLPSWAPMIGIKEEISKVHFPGL